MSHLLLERTVRPLTVDRPAGRDSLRPAVARADLLKLLLLFALLVGINLFFPRDLWVQDEARYAEVVREMLAGGHWLVPQLNGSPYADKPAPYFWAIAGIAALIGQGLPAFLLFTFLSTLASVAGVYAVGRRLGGRALGLWSGGLFLTALLPLFAAQIARMDMALTATVVWAWYALLRLRARPHGAWHAGFWTLCILGVAVKGPIALLFTLLPALAVQFATARWRGILALYPARGGVALAAVVLGWVGMLAATGQAGYLATIWYEQLLGRAIHSWNRAEPVYFYAALLPLLVMPWLGPIAAGFRLLFRERDARRQQVVAFSLLPLVAISLVSEKLFIYVLPLFPALSLAGGIGALRLLEARRVSAWAAWPPVLFVLALAAGLWRGRADLGPATAASAGWVAMGLVLLAATGAALSLRPGRQWLFGWMAVTVLLSVLLFGVLVEALNPRFSARPLGEAIARHAGPDAPAATVGTTRGILDFYAGRLITHLSPREVLPWLAAHPDGVLAIPEAMLSASLGAARVPATCGVDETRVLEQRRYHVLAGC